MKKLLILGITCTVLFGCKKSQEGNSLVEQNLVQQKRSNTAFTFSSANVDSLINQVGILHNDCMEYAFAKTKEERLFAGTDSSQWIRTASQLVTEYFSEIWENSKYPVNGDSLNYLHTLVINESMVTDALSTPCINALENANNILISSQSSREYEDEILREYESTISTLSSNEEKIIYQAYVIVSISSLRYWEENIDDWVKEYNAQNNISGEKRASRPPINRTGVAKADAEGAVAGAIFGGITGSVLAGPVGTGVGALVGSAEGSAAASLINVVFQSIFNGW